MQSLAWPFARMCRRRRIVTVCNQDHRVYREHTERRLCAREVSWSVGCNRAQNILGSVLPRGQLPSGYYVSRRFRVCRFAQSKLFRGWRCIGLGS